LGKELKQLGIGVTAVEPGMFRTDWAGRSMTRVPRRISDYDEIFDPIRTARAARSGNQPGDPIKAAQAILQLIAAPNPPAHLLLGPDALKFVTEKLRELDAEINEWKEVTLSTNFDEAAQ
jgi:NAD(P)-dependent dehydrogenase (short-subunit alcohol dehydrogenase family)